MSDPNADEHVDGTSPSSALTPRASFVEEAAVAADLFDLAAPPLHQPLVARLLPAYAGLPTIDIHQDSGVVVIGRSKELNEDSRINGCDKLSARHCELLIDPITLRIELRDISTNGTYVNGVRVAKHEKVTLQNGDRVSLTKLVPQAAAAGRERGNTAHTPANGRAEFVLQRLKNETTRADMLEELTCSICRAVFHRPCSVLPCMHVFCAGCISGWIEKGASRVCPECREPISDIRPTHRLQSCAEQFLLSDPGSRRSAEDLALLDAADIVPPTGLKMGKRQRPGDSCDDAVDSDVDDDDSDDDDDHGDVAQVMRHAGLAYANPFDLAAAHCTECDTPSTIDGFQCPAGGPHLRCSACAQPFAERPLCGRPQRCHVCNGAFCQLYRAGGCDASGRMLFRPYKEQSPLEVLPPQTFGGNTVEQSILSTYLATHRILVKDVWATTLAKFAAGEWVPDMVLINGTMGVDSPVCQRCSVRVFAELLFHYRRNIPADDLPESVTRRSNCWYGKECRTQFHKPQHAQNFNHVCYQEKRKE
jgi:E3 ubiquitin-protein ligase CHFR